MTLLSDIATLASALAIVGLGLAALRWALGFYDRTWGSRRYWQSRLDRLACGATVEYATEVLGQPIFRTGSQSTGGDTLLFRTPHAWVQLVLSRHQGITRFAITVDDPKFRFSTDSLGHGLHIILNHDYFDAVDRPNSARVALGTRRYSYNESHYLGNPGAYQTYVLGCNDVGVSDHDEAGLMDMAHNANENVVDLNSESLRVFRASSRPNTFAVIAPNLGDDVAFEGIIGPNMDEVRVLPQFRARKVGRRLIPRG